MFIPTNIRKTSAIILGATILSSAAPSAFAETTRVTVRIENVAPLQATSQTPVWLGLHDGEAFDIYNGGAPASSLPIAGSRAFESICEDGSAAILSENFSALQTAGQQTTVPGPNGPIAPGEMVEFSFEVDSNDRNTRYLSYASMVLPSNDFCVANGDPKAHQIFDESGNFVAKSFFVRGAEVLDAGTEVNDELPANTAFFGQQAPNTGVDENGVVRDTLTAFDPNNATGVLSDPRFSEADFTLAGYSTLKFTFTASVVPEVTPEPETPLALRFFTRLGSANVVPAINGGRVFGAVIARSRDENQTIDLVASVIRLARNDSITGAEIRLAASGENGPVVVDLTARGSFSKSRSGILRRLVLNINDDDLVGSLAGQSLQALQREIAAGNAYLLVKSSAFPEGHIRGQLR